MSAASGPVGAYVARTFTLICQNLTLPLRRRTVVQLAKLAGLKVIASAGSDDKVNWVKSLGADRAFNYKTTSTEEVLKAENGIDM